MGARSVAFVASGAVAGVLASTLGYVPFAGGTISAGNRNVFVSVPPCRLFDTRPAPRTIGPRSTPLGAGETVTFTVRSLCGVPAGANAAVMNVTAINPTASSFLTVFPADQPRPNASNLNWVAGQGPTPNQVTVGLSSDGRIKLFNGLGTVNVFADVVGYTETHDHDDRYDEGSSLLLVPADDTPAANGAALLAAMASITDASSSNPYTIRLAPGVYDVGVSGLDVKPFVTLQGGGQDRTIVTAPGSPDLSPSNGGVYGTVRPAGESALRDLTVRNTGGVSTIAVGVEIGDGTARLADIDIEVTGSDDTLGIAANHFANTPRLDLDRGTIEVVGGGGIGQLSSSDRYDTIFVRNSVIDVTGGGFGIGGDASRTSGSFVRVSDTRVNVTGGGTGIGGTANGELLYTNVHVNVSGGTTTLGIGGSGSGFHPVLHGSTITVAGGSASNKGFDGALFFSVTLQNTRLTASGVNAIAMELGLGSTDSGNAFVDGSVLTATTVFNSINADTQVKVGGSKLSGSTIVNGPGLFVCAASYKSDYTALSATCT